MTNYQAKLQIQLNNRACEIELARLEGDKCKANSMHYLINYKFSQISFPDGKQVLILGYQLVVANFPLEQCIQILYFYS